MPDSPNPAPASPFPWDRPRSVLLIAIWFGLVTGGIEALVLLLFALLDRCALDSYSPIIWTIPFTDAAFLTIPGLIFFFCARKGVSPRLRKFALFFFCTVAVSATIFAVCSTMTVMLFPPAVILLAAGIAWQFVRFAATRPELIHRFFARTAPILIALPLLCGVFTKTTEWWTEHRLLASLPPAAAGAPNVLLIVLDTLRAKSMSLYGHTNETTPNLKRWAQRGVVFDKAVAPSPFTLTSHAAMFTGRYPHQTAANWAVPMEKNFPTLAEVLHDRGYVTAGVVGNTFYAGRQTGLNRGFGYYVAHRLTPLEVLGSSMLCRNALKIPRHSPPAPAINHYFSKWLDRFPRRPFFAFLNYADCHVPYMPEPEYEKASREDRMRVIFWSIDALMAPNPEADPTLIDLVRNSYEGCLRGLDRHIDEILKNLEARGDLKNTIVIIVGDHGEQFGEHNLIQHADSLYRPAVHVPLLVLAPGSPAGGQRISQMVTIRDIPATILDLLKIPQGGILGDSFAAAITNGTNAVLPATPKLAFVCRGLNYPSWHPNSAGDVSEVYLDGKYLIHSTRQDELYDFETDPEERTNLISSPDAAPLLQKLKPLLPARAPK